MPGDEAKLLRLAEIEQEKGRIRARLRGGSVPGPLGSGPGVPLDPLPADNDKFIEQLDALDREEESLRQQLAQSPP